MTHLGLLSDSHGRAETTRLAVELLIDRGADILIHLGDVGSVQVIDALAEINPKTKNQIESHMVLGNTDWDGQALTRYAQDLGVHVHDPAGQIEIDGCQIAFSHGHLPAVMGHFLDAGVDYLLHGHTHVQSDQPQGKTRVINPGALFRASRYTVALLTPKVGALAVMEVTSVIR